MLAAQRGLFELGLFRKVELVPMPGQERRPDRSIVVRIDEGEQRSYLLGVGYSDRDAARVTVSAGGPGASSSTDPDAAP